MGRPIKEVTNNKSPLEAVMVNANINLVTNIDVV